MNTTGLNESRLLRRTASLLAGFGLLIAVGLGLRGLAQLADGLDRRWISSAVDHRTPALTTAAHVLSALGRTWVLVVATALFAVALRSRLGWRALGPLVAVLGSDLLQHAIKGLVRRPRPPVPHLEHVTGSSFPSGHATESAAVAIALVMLISGGARLQRTVARILLLALAAGIGASRVYLGVHYPTDVMAGIVLGSGWGVTANWWCNPDASTAAGQHSGARRIHRRTAIR